MSIFTYIPIVFRGVVIDCEFSDASGFSDPILFAPIAVVDRERHNQEAALPLWFTSEELRELADTMDSWTRDESGPFVAQRIVDQETYTPDPEDAA